MCLIHPATFHRRKRIFPFPVSMAKSFLIRGMSVCVLLLFVWFEHAQVLRDPIDSWVQMCTSPVGLGRHCFCGTPRLALAISLLWSFSFLSFHFLCRHMGVCLYEWVQCVGMLEEAKGVSYLGTGVGYRDSCEGPDRGAGGRTRNFWKTRKHRNHWAMAPSLQPLAILLKRCFYVG